MAKGVNFIWLGQDSEIPNRFFRNTDMDGRYLRLASVSEVVNSIGGTATHTHTKDSHGHDVAGSFVLTTAMYRDRGRDAGSGSHSHASTKISYSASEWLFDSKPNDPDYYEVIFIESEGVDKLPSGVAFFGGQNFSLANCNFCNGTNGTPNVEDRFLKGAGTGEDAGATGSGEHSHSGTHGHAGTSSAETDSPVRDMHTGLGLSPAGHPHTITLQDTEAKTENTTILPPFACYGLFQTNDEVPITEGMMGIWFKTSAVPLSWEIIDEFGRFIFIKLAYSTGGSDKHAHNGILHDHKVTQGSAQGRDENIGSLGAVTYLHAHNWTVSEEMVDAEIETTLPLYRVGYLIRYKKPQTKIYETELKDCCLVRNIVVPKIHLKCNDNAANTIVTNDGSLGDGVATVNTSSLSSVGKINNCFVSPSSSYVDLTTIGDGVKDDDIGTLTFWINLPTAKSFPSVFFFEKDLNQRLGIFISSKIYAFCHSDFDNQWYWASSDQTDGWHWITIIQDGSEVRMLIDNVYHAGTFIYGFNKTMWFSSLSGSVSKMHFMSHYVNYLDAGVDDFRYYNFVLSDKQLATIYNKGKGTELQHL